MKQFDKKAKQQVDPKSKKTVVSVEGDNGCKYKAEAPICTASDPRNPDLNKASA